jgi:hypothetical protein
MTHSFMFLVSTSFFFRSQCVRCHQLPSQALAYLKMFLCTIPPLPCFPPTLPFRAMDFVFLWPWLIPSRTPGSLPEVDANPPNLRCVLRAVVRSMLLPSVYYYPSIFPPTLLLHSKLFSSRSRLFSFLFLWQCLFFCNFSIQIPMHNDPLHSTRVFLPSLTSSFHSPPILLCLVLQHIYSTICAQKQT